MKKTIPLLLALVLTACASIVKVEGEQQVANRMTVQVSQAWNKISPPGAAQPYQTWTQEGIPLDELRLWAGVRPQQALVNMPAGAVPATGKARRVPTFVVGMQPDQLVHLFETMYALDGSIVTMTRVEPDTFAGHKGVRFEFSVVRRSDDVQLSGIGWVAVHKDELFAATFTAPHLAFFGRLRPMAESLIKTARIAG